MIVPRSNYSPLLTVLLLVYAATCLAQTPGGRALRVDTTYTVEQLVQNVFAADVCANITNVRRIGESPASIGLFTGSTDIVGFDRGIVLSTGRVKDAVGPNDVTDKGTEFTGLTPDKDIGRITSRDVFDRSGIEFDFVPLEPVITFRYVLASEEYCEYVGGNYNDLFGFFVSGPGLRGPFIDSAVNVARVPNTRDPVAINTINHDVNPEYYLSNESKSTNSCASGANAGPRADQIQYDGQTVILTATFRVVPCETYHIRLVIADVKDAQYDSAVFLQAGSFNLGSSVSLESGEDPDAPIIAYEGCSPTTMRVERGPDSDIDRPQTITYRVESGTATDSLDFTCGTGEVTIPAGQQFAEVPIRAPLDTLVEGDERALIILDVPCACYSDSVELIIREPAAPKLVLPDPFLYCPSIGATLLADVQGGVPPYRYEWSFGSTEAEPEVNFSLPDSVTLVLKDNCGHEVSSTTGTRPSDPPSFSLPPQDLQACWGDTQRVALQIEGTGPFEITYRRDAGDTLAITLPDSGGGRVSWPIRRGGSYHVIEIEDQACGTAADERFSADFYQPVINPTFTDPSCSERADGGIEATHLPTVGPYTYTVNTAPVPDFSLADLSAGGYTLAVTDAIGCTDSAVVDLRGPDSLRILELTCEQLRLPNPTLRVVGGTPPYRYSIQDSPFTSNLDSLLNELTPGSNYDIRVRDAAGCAYLEANYYLPITVENAVGLPSIIEQEPGQEVTVVPELRVPSNQIATYAWRPAELFDCPTCPTPTLSAPFSKPIGLTVTTVYGCVDSASTYVAVDATSPLYVPNAFSPDGDGNNDLVSVFGDDELVQRVTSFQIFNRWGHLVYADGDFAPNVDGRGWDGRIDGQPATSGVYLWVATFRMTATGELRQAEGTVTVAAR